MRLVWVLQRFMTLSIRKPDPKVTCRFITFVLLTAACVLYSGPFSKFFRAYFGDLFGIMFVYFGWRLVFPHKHRVWALFLSACMPYGVEILQWFQPDFQNSIARFLLGSVFGWKDMVMYTLGMLAAYYMDGIDVKEAKGLLMREMIPLRKWSFSDLVQQIEGETFHKEITSKNGKYYQVAIQFYWDDQRCGTIRVSGTIDDGWYSAYFPIGYGLLIENPDEQTRG